MFMIIPLYVAVALSGVTAAVGVAAIVNAVRVNREKHGEPTGHFWRGRLFQN
jgi:hypothetical protein